MGRDIALLINPTSGGGRGARMGAAAARRLTQAGRNVHVLTGRDADESADLARGVVEQGADALVVVGGDGMVHLGLQVVGGTDTPFGVIPAGGGNDFARALNIPLKDPEAAADVISRAEERKVDLGRADNVWFGCVVAAGFDARVNDRANRMRWPRGRMRYNLAMLAELGVFRPVPYVLELDGVRWETSAMLVTIGNASSYGGGMRVTPDALLDDELLDVMVVKPISKTRLLRVFPKVYSGAHVRLPYVEVRRARRIHVAAPNITAYVDGERLGPLPKTFEAVPAAVRVFAPVTTIRPTPLR